MKRENIKRCKEITERLDAIEGRLKELAAYNKNMFISFDYLLPGNGYIYNRVIPFPEEHVKVVLTLVKDSLLTEKQALESELETL
ncbi:MAG: hypothetical protein WC549_02050 [Actinomycetota bacterium]